MNCPNCNKPLRPNQRFCAVCGAMVEGLTTGAQQTENLWQPQEVQPEQPQAEWQPHEVQPEQPQTEWQPQYAQPEQPQTEWQPQYTQPEQPQTEWQPPYAQPEQPQTAPPVQPAYQPPQGGQNDRYAAQFQQYQQPSRFANPKHAQGSAEVFPKGKKKKDKK